MKYCPYCGYRLDRVYAYCPGCGEKVAGINGGAAGDAKIPKNPDTRRNSGYRKTAAASDVYRPAWKDSEAEDVYVHPERQKYEKYVKSGGEEKSFGHWLLGFLLPLVGLVLYLTLQSSKPGPAKSSGRGALVKLIVDAVLAALFMVAVSLGYIALT